MMIASHTDTDAFTTRPHSLPPRPLRDDDPPVAVANPNTIVRWGSVTQLVRQRLSRWDAVSHRVAAMHVDPRPHDVILGRVKEVGRHTGIELDTGRKARFFVGDILGLAFGWRYATRQFYGDVPPLSPEYHMLSQGGVCGRVISAPDRFSAPTVIEPLGYLLDAHGEIVNLRRYGIAPLRTHSNGRGEATETILVVGSSMDAGKTTLASNVIRGLTLAGYHVNAGKVTGTACVKDLNRMLDAGATSTCDFVRAGFASTAQSDESELRQLWHAITSHLSEDKPDYLVLEIADGLVQRETQMLMSYIAQQSLVDHVLLAVHDAMAAPTCLNMLRSRWNVEPKAISGAATASPLSTNELRAAVDVRCLRGEELARPSVVRLLESTASQVV